MSVRRWSRGLVMPVSIRCCSAILVPVGRISTGVATISRSRSRSSAATCSPSRRIVSRSRCCRRTRRCLTSGSWKAHSCATGKALTTSSTRATTSQVTRPTTRSSSLGLRRRSGHSPSSPTRSTVRTAPSSSAAQPGRDRATRSVASDRCGARSGGCPSGYRRLTRAVAARLRILRVGGVDLRLLAGPVLRAERGSLAVFGDPNARGALAGCCRASMRGISHDRSVGSSWC